MGANAVDGDDGVVTVNISGTVDTNVVRYDITYATDSAGNSSSKTRTVKVVDTTTPTIMWHLQRHLNQIQIQVKSLYL